MAVERQPVVSDVVAQCLAASWAVKTVLLLELAFRQVSPGERPVEGNHHARLTGLTNGVAFQVLTVDFLAAKQHGAALWNTHVAKSLVGHLVRILATVGGDA
jgi:hypothetical protein